MDHSTDKEEIWKKQNNEMLRYWTKSAMPYNQYWNQIHTHTNIYDITCTKCIYPTTFKVQEVLNGLDIQGYSCLENWCHSNRQ